MNEIEKLQDQLKEAKARIEELESTCRIRVNQLGIADDLAAREDARIIKLEAELTASNEAREALLSTLANVWGDLVKLQDSRDLVELERIIQAIGNCLPVTGTAHTQPISSDIKGESVPVALVEQLASALEDAYNDGSTYTVVNALAAYQSYKSGAPSKVSEVLGEVQNLLTKLLPLHMGYGGKGEHEDAIKSALAKLSALRKGNGV